MYLPTAFGDDESEDIRAKWLGDKARFKRPATALSNSINRIKQFSFVSAFHR